MTDSNKKSKVAFREEELEVYPVSESVSKGAHIASMEAYHAMQGEAMAETDKWWAQRATEMLDWFAPFNQVSSGCDCFCPIFLSCF